MRSPFSAEIVSSRNLTLVHRREHINEVQSGTTKPGVNFVERRYGEVQHSPTPIGP
jgi:hypothetical protein